MIESLSNIIIAFIGSTGYLGIFLLMTLESALIPIPSEATMTFGGFLASTGTLNFWIIIIVGTLANLFGSLLAYGLGYLGEAKVRQYGKYIFLREKEFEHAQKLFLKHGEMIVFISRMLPAIRTYISLPAGIAKMNLKKFIVYTFVGCFLWSALLTYLGLILGSNWQKITPYFHILDGLIVVAIVVAGVYLIFRFRKK